MQIKLRVNILNNRHWMPLVGPIFAKLVIVE